MKVATFSMRLETVMERKGITRSELSKRTGISRQLLHKYLKDICLPRIENVQAIAKALNVDEAYLLGYDVDENGNADDKYNNVLEIKEVNMLNKALGETIQYIRERTDLSIEKVSQKLGRKSSSIIAFEKGEEIVPSTYFIRLCYLCDYPVEEAYKDFLYRYKKITEKNEE